MGVEEIPEGMFGVGGELGGGGDSIVGWAGGELGGSSGW